MGIIIRARLRIWVAVPFLLTAALCFIAITSPQHLVHAEVVPNDLAWATADPIIASSVPVDSNAGLYCKGSYKSVNIVGIGNTWGCIQQGNSIKVGTYTGPGIYRTIISFAYDTNMYPVYGTGSCEQRGECIYIADTDTFVTKQNYGNSFSRALVIYKDFKKRLSKTTDTFGLTTGYTFDSARPDYVFKNTEDHPWPIEAISASNNGQWLAVEFQGRGLGILNMNTLEMKRITTVSPSYWQGYDPGVALAITNTGTHIVMTTTTFGTSGSIILYDVSPSCGDIANDRNMEFVIPVERPCKKFNVDSEPFIDKLRASFNPRFDDEGSALEFFAQSQTGASKAVTLYAPGYDPQYLDYLALGDSFSSGEGETDDNYYQSGTNDTFEKCHLSKRSYPYLIATSLGINPERVRSVACSGATTDDVLGNDKDYWGQGNRLGKNNLDFNSVTKSIYQASAAEAFSPGRIHQMRFVERYKPKVITIGIGGNDVGFMEKLKSCVGMDTCEWADTAEGKEKTALEVQRAFWTLVDTYTSIHKASPKSKIYVIGYPKIIDSSGQCGLLNGILLNTTERTFMNEGIVYINQVIAAAAQKAGVKYIDVESSFGNKLICGSEQPSVMNAITLGDDNSPIATVDWLKIIGKESFHPRPAGHERIASNIAGVVPNMLTYSYCTTEYSRSSSICTLDAVTAPQPSGYWLVDGVTHNYASLRVSDFVNDASDPVDLRKKSIDVPEYTFAPNSIVRAEIHSDPFMLGSATTNTSGALSFAIELPINLEQGFHTVHLYGTSYSGEPIDLYQVIKYVLPTPDDTPSSKQIDNTSPQIAAPASQVSELTTTNNDTSDTAASTDDTHHPAIARIASSPEVLGETIQANQPARTDPELHWVIAGLVLLGVIGFVMYRIAQRRHG